MKITIESHIDLLSKSSSGTYYVSKKRVIKKFSWGSAPESDFYSCSEARLAMINYINSEKNPELLNVTLVEGV
jgi:hypothetical protein